MFAGTVGCKMSDICRSREAECLAETLSSDRALWSSRFCAACSHLLQVSLILLVLFGSEFVQSPDASAGTFGQNCSFSRFMTRTATAVTGPRSLRLDDGTEVVVAGILPPSKLDHPSVSKTWALPARTAKALSEATIGRTIELSGNERARDRYGRRIAQIRVLSGQHQLWLQAYLARTGAARILIKGTDDICKANALLRHEQAARGRSAGLWADAAYAIRKASKPWELLRYRSTLQIVEGRVWNVSRVRSRIYINFGKNWRRDFTIGIRRKVGKTARIRSDIGAVERSKHPRSRMDPTPWRPLCSTPQSRPDQSRTWQKIAGDLPKGQTRRPLPAYQPKQKRPTFAKPDAIDL